MSSMNKALAVAEVLGMIIEQIADAKSLAACARTCHAWNEIAIPVLWRGSLKLSGAWDPVADIGHLDRLAVSPDRFSHYLRHVRHLDLRMGDSKGECERLWNADLWQSAKYCSLKVDLGSDVMSEPRMEMLLHNGLLAVLLFGGVYSDHFLDTIRSRCPRLRWLLLDDRSESITSRKLLQTLQALPDLHSIELVYGFEFAVNEPVLQHIANMQCLKSLALGQTDAITPHILQTSHHKLRNLQYLDLQSAEGPGLQMLLPQLIHLRAFELFITDPTSTVNLQSHVLLPISRCSKLRGISISVAKPWYISTSCFNAFVEGCKELHYVEFVRLDEVTADEATDLDVVHILANKLRCLEELGYHQPCVFGQSELMAFARNCPNLHDLSLRASFRPSLLSCVPNDIVFPQLRYLAAQEFVMETETVPEALQLRIDEILPSLASITQIDNKDLIGPWGEYCHNLYKTKRLLKYTFKARYPVKLHNALQEAAVYGTSEMESL